MTKDEVDVITKGNRALGLRMSQDGRLVTAWSQEPYLSALVSRTGSGLRRWEVRVYLDRHMEKGDRILIKRFTRMGALGTMARVFAEAGVDIGRLIYAAQRDRGVADRGR